MTFHAEAPYNDLPSLPPADVELETRAVLKATIRARAALAALDQAARLLPNPQVLPNAASLLEAQASSEIENIVTTTDELFRFVDDERNADPTAKEALRYRSALYEGVQVVRVRPLTFSTCELVCTRIAGHTMGVRTLAGTRIANPDSGAVIYAPPEGPGLIQAKLSDWERFVHAGGDLDPLVRMAVAHYQFEAIHPFPDGNGRTGRIVNILMLIESGLIEQPILYLSRSIIKAKNDYYRLLREVTSDGSWEPWILFMLTAVATTAEETTVKIGLIRGLQSDLHEQARAASAGGRNADFLAALFEQPYTRIASVMNRCDISRPTATAWLSQLSSAGVLEEVRSGRDRLFVNRRFLQLLESAEPPVKDARTPTLF